MALITLREVSIGFRGPLLLDGVSCQIEPGQKIGLLGRNGAGKTTLMRLLSGQLLPDHGDITMDEKVRVAQLAQDVPTDTTGSVAEVVERGVVASANGSFGPATESDDWQRQHAVDRILSLMKLDGSAGFQRLSSGMQRRVLLAQALVSTPDVLLLDEPTNHLDVDAIAWLEDFLVKWKQTLMFVTHDRMFLRRIATRILEIDRGNLFDWSCDYDTFLKRKEEALEAEEKQQALFDKRLAKEEAWIRQGIKARRTRNEGRVKALKRMREVRRTRPAATGQVNLRIQEGDRSGRLVTAVDGLTFSYGERPIVSDFSTMIMRGDRVGIIGPNGAGKTTLLRLLLGQLEPQQGTVRLGTNLQLAYFDQLREQLNEHETVQHNVSDGYDTIKINGRSQHVIGYLQNFLFSPERARTEVRFLSGGERNRILLAKLFAKPANILVLDEPTNDLDAETLELLEQRLTEFNGTVLLVSHDREFLNNVVTSTIVFEADGVREYVGGYDDWVRQRPSPDGDEPARKNSDLKTKRPPKRASGKLSYKETRELQALPATIEALEEKIAALHEVMANPDFYQRPGEQIAKQQQRLSELNEQLQTAYARWETLESGKSG